MTREEYRRYLQSHHWQRTRARILARAGARCEWCGRFCGRAPHAPDACCFQEHCEWCQFYFDEDGHSRDRERQSLEIHHKTYERIGQERDEDLVALCWSCHDGVTERQSYLRDLQRAGLIHRSDATPTAAATRWGAILRRIFGGRSWR